MNITEDMYEVKECGCWEWLGNTNAQGYAVLNGRTVHRVWWSVREGEIPTGWQVDHLCFNNICVNPDHHEAVPARVNQLRRKVRTRMLPWATHCVRGHELNDMTTVWRADGSGRQCRICRDLRMKESANRLRGTKITPTPKWSENGSLRNKDLYEVTDELLEEAQVGEYWLEIFGKCHHTEGSSVAITKGRAKNVSLAIDKAFQSR